MLAYTLTHSPRDCAILTALNWLASQPVYLDTETTGLGTGAEICDLAIIDQFGKPLFDSLIKPCRIIPDAAIEVHHITNEMVAKAPTIADCWPKIRWLLSGRVIITYNADYDLRLLYQSAAAGEVSYPGVPFLQVCDAMQLYAQFYGANNERGGYRWQRLVNAAEQCGIDPGEDPLHRALADTRLTRLLMIHVAQSKMDEAE